MNEPHPLSPMSALRHGITDFNAALRDDSYINFATGLGMPGTDKSRATYYGRERVLQPTELQNMYQSNAYATRIVDRLVDDATRVDWYLTGVDRKFDWNSVKSQVDDLGGLSAIGDAWRWSRLYGGGLVVMPIDDGQHYSRPLDLSAARKIRPLTTLDSTTTLVRGYMASLGSVAWSEPTGYQVLVPTEGQTGGFAMIHPSRVIRFDGCRVPAAMMVNNGGWSPSVLQRCKKQLEAYGTVLGYAQEILHDISVMFVQVPGFSTAMLGDSGISNAREVLRQLRWGIDNLNLLVMDTDAKYQEIKRSVEGLEKLINAFERDLVGASGMSRLILTGEQASGLGASSSDEVRSWYDSVGKEQKFTITPALNRLLQVIFAIRANRGEPVPTEWTIRYEALWTPEPKAKAEIAEIWVRTINDAQMGGLMDPDEGKALLVANGVLEDLPEADDTATVPGPNDLEVDPTATATPAEEQAPTEPEAAPVAEQALNSAQVSSLVEILAQVSAGTLAPTAAEWVIGQAVPAAVATPTKLAQTKAAVAAAAAQKPPALETPAVVPAQTQSPTAEQAPTDDDEPDEENPIDVAWSNDPLPADAMTAKEIAVIIGVKTGRVTRLVREGRLRQWNVLGKKLISLRDIRAIILEDNTTDADTVRLDPFPNEHAARQREPDEFIAKTFHRVNIAKGIDLIVGKLRSDPDGGMVPQTYRFAAEEFTLAQAKKWLKEHGLHTVLEEATKTDSRECSLTISVRPPRSIAQWVPYNPYNPHPPHVTIVHAKDVHKRQAALLVEALQDITRTVAPVPITTGDVGYFDHEHQRIAWSGVESEALAGLYEMVVTAAQAAGIEVEVHENGYHPHMTLAQLGLGEEYHGASPPVGSTWDADALVVEYDGTITVLPLAGNTSGAGEVAPA